MRIPIQWSCIKCLAFIVLSLSAGTAIAQSTISTIPQQVNQSAQTKAVTKTNTVTNSAMNSLDSASNKAFKGFTGMFKKKAKNKKSKTDSTGLHPADTTAVPPKSSFRTGVQHPSFCSIQGQQQPYSDAAANDRLFIPNAGLRYTTLRRRTLPILSVRA